MTGESLLKISDAEEELLLDLAGEIKSYVKITTTPLTNLKNLLKALAAMTP
jgi:hypothetical protein